MNFPVFISIADGFDENADHMPLTIRCWFVAVETYAQ